MRVTTWQIAALALAGTSAGSAGAQVTPAVEPMVPASGTVLDITAQGLSTRVPDLATIRAGVVTQGTTAATALSDNAARMGRVLQALRRSGVAARDLSTNSVTLQPQYRHGENLPPVITGYQATNSVAVRFRDIARAGTILDTLVAEGANQIDGPALAIDDPDAALNEARADAVKRARARADLYARAAGLSVVRVVSIAEAGQDAGEPGQPPVIQMRMAAATPRTEIVAGEKQLSATLSVRFLLR